MKLRADIVEVYREVHSWVGILTALFLFVAFYAGAISMFEPMMQNWLSPESHLPAPVSLERTPELMGKAFAAFPETRKHYMIVLNVNRTQPARMVWSKKPDVRGNSPKLFVGAALDQNGALVTEKRPSSEAAYFIDVLHQRVGLPFSDDVAMPIMGVVALAYAVALVSGVIAFLPALKKSLFAVRLEGARRRAWLDLHNVFGFFSLPFHIVMAVTSVVFAFHEPIYAVQKTLFHKTDLSAHVRPHDEGVKSASTPLEPAVLVAALARQAPGFVPNTLQYAVRGDGVLTLRVAGYDTRFPMRGPNVGFAMMDPLTGRVILTDYLPGHQPTGFAVLTSFFSLHFGSYGGAPVRWGYLVLGFSGAFLFYTGNQLWIMARRRRERASGLEFDTRGTRILSSLTIGCCTGCMTGIAAVLTVAAFWPVFLPYMSIAILYYAIFVLCVLLACLLPSRRKASVLFTVAGISNAFLAAVAMTREWHLHDGTSMAVAAVALLLAAGLLLVPVKMRRLA